MSKRYGMIKESDIMKEDNKIISAYEDEYYIFILSDKNKSLLKGDYEEE